MALGNKLNTPSDCNIKETLEDLGHAIAVTQHHDAVTGTEKQYVTEDYHLRLDKSVQNFLNCAGEENNPIVEVGKYNCPLLNISQCNATENKKSFFVSVYNPLPRKRSWTVRLPITFNESTIVSRKVSSYCILLICLKTSYDLSNTFLIEIFPLISHLGQWSL